MLGKKANQVDEAGRSKRTLSSDGSEGSVISKAMHITGDCVVEGTIRIEGKISGSVRARGLELAEGGTVEGDLAAFDRKGAGAPFVVAGRVDGAVRAPKVEILQTGAVLKGVEADEAHVRGRIEGGILVRGRLILEQSAVVEGDVRARTLALKEGGQVNGTIVMGDRASPKDGAVSKAQNVASPEDEPAVEPTEAVANAG